MKKRETELDILRIVALLGVIFTHACGICTKSPSVELVTTFLLATVTWHVPVFVMISGRFFLDPARNMSAAKIKQAIIHLAVAFIVWNIPYQVCYYLQGAYAGLNWKGLLSSVLIGPYHFWYMYMLICMYAITPFLRKITESKPLMEYFIVLFLIFEFITLYGVDLPLIGATLAEITRKVSFHFALGYSGYYILGCYLRQHPLRGRRELALYLLGICMFLFTGLATVWKTAQGAEGKEWFSKYLMPNVIIEAAAVYTFFINRIGKIRFAEKVESVISHLAEYSFGAYLIHALVLDLLAYAGFGKLPLHPLVLIFVTLVLTFVISIGATALIRKIPHIGRKIT